jgi:hypothetical protein
MEQSRLGRWHGNADLFSTFLYRAFLQFMRGDNLTEGRSQILVPDPSDLHFLSAGSRDSDPTERGFALRFELVDFSETIWLPTPPVPWFTMRDPEQGHITRWNGFSVPLRRRPGIPLLVVKRVFCLAINRKELPSPP